MTSQLGEQAAPYHDRGVSETALELRGLTADNLLAFLALLGLMRALDTERPEWRPRVAWRGPPWRAALHIDANVDASAVAGAADAGVLRLGQAYSFEGHKNIDYTGEEFRRLALDATITASSSDRRRADVLGALATDVNLKPDGKVQATALCAIFGQGHQNFLERLRQLAHDRPARNDGSVKIAEALFEDWRYEDLAATFRWDPQEDRRYALGFADPSGQKIRTVAGANRLAVIGLPLFAAVPTGRGVKTVGVQRSGRVSSITWPVWVQALSLSAVRALLDHPELLVDQPDRSHLAQHGVGGLMRARRTQFGKYFSFEPARPLWGSPVA